MNETFEQIYKAVINNVCRDYEYAAKLPLGTQFYFDGTAAGQLQALFVAALYLDADEDTLDELRAL